jgi:hypothetical protein
MFPMNPQRGNQGQTVLKHELKASAFQGPLPSPEALEKFE